MCQKSKSDTLYARPCLFFSQTASWIKTVDFPHWIGGAEGDFLFFSLSERFAVLLTHSSWVWGWVFWVGDENLRGLKPPPKSVLIHAVLSTESMLKPVWPSSQQVAWQSMLSLNQVHYKHGEAAFRLFCTRDEWPSLIFLSLFFFFFAFQARCQANDHLLSHWRGWEWMHFSDQVSLKFVEEKLCEGLGVTNASWNLSSINSRLAKARSTTLSELHLLPENSWNQFT